MSQKEDAPAQEDKKANEELPAKETEAKADETKEGDKKAEPKQEESIGQAFGDKSNDKPDSVPMAAFLEEKNGRKEAEKQLKDISQRLAELEQARQDGTPKAEITADMRDLADEYNVDPQFLSKLASGIKATTESEMKAQLEERLKPLQEKEKQAEINKAFNKGFKSAMEGMPELKDVVNKDVIKTLSLDPSNAKKTFTQLIQETYGHLATGKTTAESTKPGGGKEPATVDFDKARKDTEYFKQVMANPELKKQYNEGLAQRLSL